MWSDIVTKHKQGSPFKRMRTESAPRGEKRRNFVATHPIGSLSLLRQCLAVMFDVPPYILLDPRYVPSVMDMTAGVFVFVSGDDKARCLK